MRKNKLLIGIIVALVAALMLSLAMLLKNNSYKKEIKDYKTLIIKQKKIEIEQQYIIDSLYALDSSEDIEVINIKIDSLKQYNDEIINTFDTLSIYKLDSIITRLLEY